MPGAHDSGTGHHAFTFAVVPELMLIRSIDDLTLRALNETPRRPSGPAADHHDDRRLCRADPVPARKPSGAVWPALLPELRSVVRLAADLGVTHRTTSLDRARWPPPPRARRPAAPVRSAAAAPHRRAGPGCAGRPPPALALSTPRTAAAGRRPLRRSTRRPCRRRPLSAASFRPGTRGSAPPAGPGP